MTPLKTNIKKGRVTYEMLPGTEDCYIFMLAIGRFGFCGAENGILAESQQVFFKNAESR